MQAHPIEPPPVHPLRLPGFMSQQPSFVHLRLHGEYSILDGSVRIDDAVAAAKSDAMPALALTDRENLFGLVKFYKAARAAGIKPIIGCDVAFSNDTDPDQPNRAVLLCRSRDGYLRLCDWLTRGFRTNQRRGRAELRSEWLDEGTDGLIALSGGRAGDVGAALAQGNPAAAAVLAQRWMRRFPDAYYLEVQRCGAANEEAINAATAALAGSLDVPLVATHPVQFLRPSDFRGHEARFCISEGYVLGDPRRPRPFTEQQYFKSQAEMQALFADLPEALANSVEIARRCNLSITLGKSFLPDFPTPGGESLDDYLRAQARAGLERRIAALYPDPGERASRRPAYEERLEFETRTIVQMGFSGYFLIVADFINWAKQNGVPVGPGRGSGAGSLAAYSLGITDLDPLRYQLLFERFLNPERVSMPDFDIDFCQDGRDRVIDYVKRRFGAESVSQIATFGTMAAKAAVRDVGRVLDLGYGFCDGIAKLIPFQPGKTITLKMAREMEPQLAERERAEEEVRELLELAEQVEGLTRNVGMHAGGVLIAPGKLTDFCPLYAQAGSDALVSQFDKDDVEAIGLVKFDFLGLTTLTILDWTLRYVRKLDPASTLTLEALPLDDRATYEIFRQANATAVFQFESRGMKDMLRQAKPDRFEDLIALVALYRPGPMDLIPDFIARKHGREKVEYLDPRLEPILGPTYGVMVYQEQVMQIAQVIGGYTLGGADLLRRAMGKKKPEEMAHQRGIFVAGAVKNGLSEGKATLLFDLMEKFAGYGFNKSHAAAYALIAFQTAYFKAHHTAAFMAANLSLVMDDTDKVRILYDDALSQGLAFLPPDVNESAYRFEPVDTGRIRYGLGAIKGTGEAAIAALVAARERGGRFRDLFDFCRRVDKKAINRRVVETLIRAGAFDAVDANRAALIASVGAALDSAEQAERDAAQVSLFDDESEHTRFTPAAVAPWSELERLRNEKLALGFYVSGHPYRAYEPELARLVRTRLDQLQPRKDPVLIAGIIVALRVQVTRRGKMALVTLDDGRENVEVAVYNEVFEAARALLREDQLLIAEVRVMQRISDGGEVQGLRVIADALHDIDGVRRKFARGIRITCNGGTSGERLAHTLRPYRLTARRPPAPAPSGTDDAASSGSPPELERAAAAGATSAPGARPSSGDSGCPIRLTYTNGQASGDIEFPDSWRVVPDETLIASLREWLSPENVEVVY
jgi:DNA polymerase-3 subunit alpha